MTGWAMFWLFCAVCAACGGIRDYLYHRRVIWAIKNGFSYNKETELWERQINACDSNDNGTR